MAFKFLLIATVIAVACAASRPLSNRYDDRRWNRPQEFRRDQDNRDSSSDPDYSYGYAIRDDWTGDWKSQHESRQGDRVRGQYRMMESDGSERIVDYSADDWSGFNAVVRHEPEWRQHPVQIVTELRPVEQQQQQQIRYQDRAATSDAHIALHSGPQPWAISNRVRHN
uniref:Putative structural contituent of cuticle n=1 Tax=Culex tarsalis TaxID=7177 RepID=A0A1Q3FQU6_CULTA